MIKDFLKYPMGFNSFDLQLFAEGDKGGGAGGESGDNIPAFSGKFVEKTDPVSGSKVMIPIELDVFFGHTISKTRDSVKTEYEGKFKPMIEALEKEAGEGSQAKAELEKLRLESMSADERAAEAIRKNKQELDAKYKTKEEEATAWKLRFEKSTIKNDIMSSFGDAKLCNASQTAILFEHEGQARICEILDEDGKPTGMFETRVTLMLETKEGRPEKMEGTAQELFKKWIQLERNSHHVMNTMPAGSGSRPGGGNISGSRMSQEDIMKMNPAARIQLSREQGKK